MTALWMLWTAYGQFTARRFIGVFKHPRPIWRNL